MNSPYYKRFYVTQKYTHGVHDGLDLVGIDSKEIHAVDGGTVVYAGWENPNNHSQGFGQYVAVKSSDGLVWYYGHMSEIKVKTGDTVKITDVLGIEGSTGHSTGSHVHICARRNGVYGQDIDVSERLGIPNAECSASKPLDDGYRVPTPATITNQTEKTISVEIVVDGKTYSGTLKEKKS